MVMAKSGKTCKVLPLPILDHFLPIPDHPPPYCLGPLFCLILYLNHSKYYLIFFTQFQMHYRWMETMEIDKRSERAP